MHFGANSTCHMKRTKSSKKTDGIAAKIFLACVVILLVATSNAYAYIDPGSGALVWQLLLSAFFGAIFFIRGVRLWIRDTMNWIWARIRGKK